MVDHSLPKTINMSSPKIKIISHIKTRAVYHSEALLRQKYEVEGLSPRQIAILTGCAHSTINHALDTFNIPRRRQVSGRIPYGYKIVKGRRIQHLREQKII